MTKPPAENGIWFVYDGECPLCTMAAQVLRIKKEYGTLHLVNAREINDTSLMKEIALRGLDLDAGMVIYAQGRFYHGKDALKFMARYGEGQNISMVFCKALFRFGFIAALAYPVMSIVRNRVLRIQGIGRINNL